MEKAISKRDGAEKEQLSFTGSVKVSTELQLLQKCAKNLH